MNYMELEDGLAKVVLHRTIPSLNSRQQARKPC
jgi:hypothetical protein